MKVFHLETLAMFEDPLQVAFVLIVVLVLFGAPRMKGLMEKVGKGLRDVHDLSHRITRELYDDEPDSLTSHSKLPVLTGQTAKGIPVYSGKLVIPDAEESKRIATRVYILVIQIVCIFCILFSIDKDFQPVAVLAALIGVLIIILHNMSALRNLTVKRRFGHLVSIETLSDRYAVPELTVLLDARERGIRPRCIIDGHEYFAISDIDAGARLLRPADAPNASQALLVRPATSSTPETQHLLRPAGQDDSDCL